MRFRQVFLPIALILAAGCAAEEAPADVSGSGVTAPVADTAADAGSGDVGVTPSLDATPDAAKLADTTDAAAAPSKDAADGAVVDTSDAAEPDADAGTPRSGDLWVTNVDRDPYAIHMTWQRDASTTVTVSWATTDTDIDDYTPRLWVAPRALAEGEGFAMRFPYDEALVFEGEATVFRESLLGVEWGDPFVVYHVEATGLTPDTEYVYRVGTWAGIDEAASFVAPDLSEPGSFVTAPPKGSKIPLSFMLSGDSRGGTDMIAKHSKRLAEMDARLWFFNGDFTDAGTQLEWYEWWAAMDPVMRTSPLMPVQGNHELFAELFYAQHALPRAPDLSPDLQEHAWSLDYGNIHFVGLDSNTPEMTEDQIPWLDADLAAARKDSDIDWIIVMFHHPPYSASNHGSIMRIRDAWVPVFEKHDVDLVFTGHDHNYERTVPILADEQVAKDEGIVYVVAGAFFSPPYNNGKEWFTATSTHGDKANYMSVTVTGGKLEATAWSGDGTEILDEFTLEKP